MDGDHNKRQSTSQSGRHTGSPCLARNDLGGSDLHTVTKSFRREIINPRGVRGGKVEEYAISLSTSPRQPPLMTELPSNSIQIFATICHPQNIVINNHTFRPRTQRLPRYHRGRLRRPPKFRRSRGAQDDLALDKLNRAECTESRILPG